MQIIPEIVKSFFREYLGNTDFMSACSFCWNSKKGTTQVRKGRETRTMCPDCMERARGEGFKIP